MGWFNKYSDGVGAQRRAEKKDLLGAGPAIGADVFRDTSERCLSGSYDSRGTLADASETSSGISCRNFGPSFRRRPSAAMKWS